MQGSFCETINELHFELVQRVNLYSTTVCTLMSSCVSLNLSFDVSLVRKVCLVCVLPLYKEPFNNTYFNMSSKINKNGKKRQNPTVSMCCILKL